MAYNGWTNQSTWLVNLWFGDTFADLADEYGRNVSAELFKEWVQSYVEEQMGAQAGLIADFVNNSLGEVDWRELESHYTPAADPEEDGRDWGMEWYDTSMELA